MKLDLKLGVRPFIVGLALGLFYVYLSDDPPVMVVYPTPDTVDLFQYKKKEGGCYRYDLNEVSCPMNTNLYDVSKKK